MDLQHQMEDRTERLEAALNEILRWCDAYPAAVFPVPDFKRVGDVLAQAGTSLDAVQGASMRHVIEGVGKIARDALEATP